MGEFDAEISCKICKRHFTAPKLVECLHTFCESCIREKVNKRSPDTFTCPVCKHETKLVGGSTESLVTNSYITTLQNLKVESDASNCAVCSLKGQESLASHRCLSCHHNLCGNCAKGHNSSTITFSHRVVSLHEIREGPIRPCILKKDEIGCRSHPDRAASVFCFTCCEPVCVDCMLEDHRPHSNACLPNALETKLKHLSKKLNAETKKPVIGESLERAESDLELLEAEEEFFFDYLRKQTDYLIEKVTKECYDLHEEAQKAFDEERRARKKKVEQAEHHVSRRRHVLDLCQRALDSGGLEVLEMYQGLQKGLKLITQQNQPPDYKLKTFIARSMPDEQKIISLEEVFVSSDYEYIGESKNQSLSDTTLGEVGDGKLGKQGPKMDESAEVSKRELSADTALVEENKSSPEKTKSKKDMSIEKSSKEPSTDNAVVRDKDTQNAKIKSKKKKKKKRKRGKKSKSKATGGNETTSEAEQLSSDSSSGSGSDSDTEMNTAIMIFRLGYKRTFRVKISNDKAEANISCMKFRSPDTCLVMDKGNRKLKIMKLSGELLYLVNLENKCPPFESFVHFPSGDLIFAVYENKLNILTRHLKPVTSVPLPEKSSSPPVVANYVENVIVGNLPKSEMRVINSEGNLVRSFKTKFKKPQESITHVADDKMVMTSCSGTGAVVLESESSGIIVQIDGEQKGTLRFQPSQAVVDSSGRKIFCDTKAHKIFVFTSGGSIHAIHDTMGDCVAEPKCMFLDANDNVYVSYKGGKIAVYGIALEKL